MRYTFLIPKFFALFLLLGCGDSYQLDFEENIGPIWSNLESEVVFSEDELEVLRRYDVVVFRGKVILDAQPPISEKEKAQIESLLTSPLPKDVLELWQVSFGGELDYDYDLLFGEHVYSASFAELFFTGSDHYHDLLGWIETDASGDLPVPFLPIGGFEYLERAYLILEGDNSGKVAYWAQGLPPAWKNRLNEDSISISASSVLEIFDQLYLSVDPFAPQPENSYFSGSGMVEKVKESRRITQAWQRGSLS